MTASDWVTVLVSIIIVIGGGFVSLVIGWLFWLAKMVHGNSKRIAANSEVCGYMKHNIPQLWNTYDEFRKGRLPKPPSPEERQLPPGKE